MKTLIHGGDIYTCIGNDKKIIDFSANINPFGMPESIKKALIENIDSYVNYPDPLCRDLRKAIGHYENINLQYIQCGNGAADLIFKIVLALKPNKALLLAPTFAEYEEALKLVNCNIEYYDLLEKNNFSIGKDIFECITEDLDIVFLCNPNNPTGIPISNKVILKLANICKKNKVILVVDECFVDFLKEEKEVSILEYIENYNNLIVLKAFTKMYAMAGIRLGYMFCSNIELSNKIESIGQPWNVSTVASKCGIAALGEKDFVLNTKEYIDENRKYLINELRDIGYKVFESKVNYILFKTDNLNLNEELKKYGILIRCCENYRNLEKGYFRIAVKSKEDNEFLIRCIRHIEGK